MSKIYVLMRFYDGGGLAHERTVKCNTEEELEEQLVEFEGDCVSQNLGTRIGVLEKEEFDKIANSLKEM